MGRSKNVGCGFLPVGRKPLVDGRQVVVATAVDRTDQRLGGIGMQSCSGRRIPQSFGPQHKQGVQLKLLPQLG